jgi:hypothetical protein
MMAMPVLGSCDDARCRADPEPIGGKGVSLYVLRRSRLWLFGHASCPLRWLLRVSQSPLASMPNTGTVTGIPPPRQQCRRRHHRRLDWPRRRRGDRIGGLLRATAAGLLRSAARLLRLLMTLDSSQHLRFECSDENNPAEPSRSHGRGRAPLPSPRPPWRSPHRQPHRLCRKRLPRPPPHPHRSPDTRCPARPPRSASSTASANCTRSCALPLPSGSNGINSPR